VSDNLKLGSFVLRFYIYTSEV